MNTTARRARIVYLLVGILVIGVIYLFSSLMENCDEWVMSGYNRHIYTNGALKSAGTVYDREGDALVSTVNGKRTFASGKALRKSTLHVVGDAQGFISTGIQTTYRKELIGYNLLTGVYVAQKPAGSDVQLTVSGDVSKAALEALGNRKGAVCVYNYETGEIICMVSTPTFDPANKPEDVDTDTSGKYEGVYLNRCLSSSYIPGSTFKIITAAAALENISDINEREFHCDGSYKTGDGTVICNGVHGTIDFTQALNQSCNSAFAQIANELGSEKLTEQAEKMGFNGVQQIDRVTLSKSVLNLSGASKTDLGWRASVSIQRL